MIKYCNTLTLLKLRIIDMIKPTKIKRRLNNPFYRFFRFISRPIVENARLVKCQDEWFDKNIHNYTVANNKFSSEKVQVGNYTYGSLNVEQIGIKEEKLLIGNFCSIADNVLFILSGGHAMDTISTYPFGYYFEGNTVATCKGPIVLDDDVWIGSHSIILSGVHICQGAVIAAGAVVSKDVPPYAVVGGVPATIIKYRFSSDVIKVLLTIDYSKLTKKMIKDHIDDLYSSLDGLTADEVEKKIAWMPKK